MPSADPGSPREPAAAGPAAAEPDSLTTVLIALAANALIAVAKTVAAVITGAASMLAEAAHSWADTGNEVLLWIAGRRSVQPPDRLHPIGYGREAYVWALFAGFGLFGVGAVVSIMHGISELQHPDPASDFLVSYVVLAIAFVLEGISFRTALKQARSESADGDTQVLDHVLRTSDPTLRAVFFEDAAALIGLVIAFVGILAHEVTGSAVPDAIGSILVGVLLAVVAVVLIQKNRRFLVGVTVEPEIRAAALQLLYDHSEIASVSFLHIEYVGPSKVYFVAAVDLVGDEAEHSVAQRLNDLEDELERTRPRIVRATLTLSRPGAPPITQ